MRKGDSADYRESPGPARWVRSSVVSGCLTERQVARANASTLTCWPDRERSRKAQPTVLPNNLLSLESGGTRSSAAALFASDAVRFPVRFFSRAVAAATSLPCSGELHLATLIR